MKKKLIEEIPYMMMTTKGKKYQYVAVQFERDIKGEPHLFVEVYQNIKKAKMPKIRMIFTKSDWGLFYPEQKTWSSAGVKDIYGKNVWEDIPEEKSETFMAQQDQDAIWEFCGAVSLCYRKYNSWTDRLQRMVEDIRGKRRDKRRENRNKRLKEREENTPELPEDIKAWAEKRLFPNFHFLYYKRNGKYADIACSHCGKVMTVRTERRDTFEGQFETIMNPKNGEPGRCPECKVYGTWKPQGKTKGVWAKDKYCFVGQPYKGTGAVIRYVQVEKLFTLNESTGEKDTEMTGAGEKYIITEIARRYIVAGQKHSQTDYNKYDPWKGKTFWDDCNLYGMNNISIKPAPVYEKTYKMLQGTVLQYSGAEEFQKGCVEYNLMDYMERYSQYPQIEMFSKMGLYGVVAEMINGRCGIIADQRAATPEDFLGIYKKSLKLLVHKNGDLEYLNAMKKERRMQKNWTGKELVMVRETGAKQGDLELALRYMSMKQLVNRLEKYAGCQIPDSPDDYMCGRASGALRVAAQTYFDYINMRQQEGYDLNNSVFAFPRNLQQAHDLMVAEMNKAEIDKRESEVKTQYPDIRKKYQRLRKQYFYEDEYYLIRPARSAEEIVREGRVLHHCVGGNGYLEKHNNGESIILFLRVKSMPETPYITVEIKDTKIIQWYGAYDKKPDRDNMDRWLKEYTVYLQEQMQVQQAG